MEDGTAVLDSHIVSSAKNLSVFGNDAGTNGKTVLGRTLS